MHFVLSMSNAEAQDQSFDGAILIWSMRHFILEKRMAGISAKIVKPFIFKSFLCILQKNS